MHELAIARNIAAIVEDAAAGRRVKVITLEVGQLSGVMSEAISFCFETVLKDTALDGARLEIREIPGRARCRSCGSEFATPALYTPCTCGSRDFERIAGEELNIKSMEIEEAA